jgi:tRNA 2-thiouridine synthesizing protein E
MPMFNFNGKAIETDNEGFFLHPDDWSEDMAPALAKTVGIDTLTELHLKVIRFMRSDFKARGEVPTIRRIKNEGGVGTKELYELFPNGPAKKAALIAGLSKPHGCV